MSDRFLECTHPGGDTYAVQLPSSFSNSAGRAWPVIVLLHGSGRNHRTLWDDPRTRNALEACRSVLVFPNGKQSWWLGSYEQYPLDLLDWLTPRLNISRDARHRAAAGWSMGGFGSLRLVELHRDRFAAWGGLLTLADFPNPDLPPEQNHNVPAVFGDKANWPALNPLRRADALRGKRLFVLTATEAFDRTMNRRLHESLTRLGIEHEYHEVDGGHRFDVVAAHLAAMLTFLDRSIHEEKP
ncbi:MAG: hypothetical protein JNL98_24835 [Bryobacterales bacterium]|nr:hypothetical protein [Bryobacterales bacterium]